MDITQEIQKLILQLENSDAEIREEAALELAKIGSKDVVEILLSHLNDPVPEVREMVIYGLGQTQSEIAIPDLVNCLKDPSLDVRWVAVEALREIGSEQASAALITCLEKDSEWNVRASAVKALAKISSEQKIIRTLVKSLQHDENFFVRREAVYALSQLDFTKEPVVCSVNHLGQLLYRNFERWLKSGWHNPQSLGLELQLPQFQYAAARSLPNAEPDLLEAEVLVAENLANTDPSHPLASVRMAKTLRDFSNPVALVISVSQVSDVEPVNILLQLHSLNGENLPVDISIKLLDEQGQPEHFADDPDAMIESRSNGRTKAIYLPFKYPKRECFSLEITRGDIKVREQFFV